MNRPALLLALNVSVTVRLYASVTVMEPMESPRIALVADADCRLLLELRYLSMKRWEDIAGEMQMCRTSVYLLHRRALDMVETILRTREECARHDAQ